MEMTSTCQTIILLFLFLITTLENTRGQHAQHIGTNDHEGKLYNVSVTCGQDALVVRVHSRRPFVGRLYVRDRYRDPNCSVLGDGHKGVSLTLKYHGSCGLTNMGNGTLATKVVIQRHPRIMLREDESYRVLCYFRIDSQTVISNTLDVRGELPASSLTLKAPRVRLRIMDMTGNDVTTAKMGDDLILLIELVDSSVYGIMARDLVISSPAEANSITLMDSNGCIQEPSVFPQLASHPPSKDLVGRFRAFRFPNDPVIRFRVTVSFCWNYCRPVICPHNTDFGYGRKRRAAGVLQVGRTNIISRALPMDVTLELAMVIEDRGTPHDDVGGNHVFRRPEVLFRPPERNELQGRAPVFPTGEQALIPPFQASSGGLKGYHQSSKPLVPLQGYHQSSRPLDSLQEHHQSSNPLVPLQGHHQSSNPLVPLQGYRQLSRPLDSLQGLQGHHQSSNPLDSLQGYRQSTRPLAPLQRKDYVPHHLGDNEFVVQSRKLEIRQ